MLISYIRQKKNAINQERPYLLSLSCVQNRKIGKEYANKASERTVHKNKLVDSMIKVAKDLRQIGIIKDKKAATVECMKSNYHKYKERHLA